MQRPPRSVPTLRAAAPAAHARALASTLRRHVKARPPRATADADPPTSLAPPDRARYHAFELDGCEFLVSLLDDGRLDLRDAYVLDKGAGVYARPSGDDPATLPPPAPFVAVPWEEKFHGDTLYRKPPRSRTLRMYLVPSTARDGGDAETAPLDLTTVVVLDADARSVARAPVVDQTTKGAQGGTTLRIR